MTKGIAQAACVVFAVGSSLAAAAGQDALPGADNTSASRFEVPHDNAKEQIALILRLSNPETRSEYIRTEQDYKQALVAVVAAGQELFGRATDAERALAGYDQAIGYWLLGRYVHLQLIDDPTDKGFQSMLEDMQAYFSAADRPSHEAVESAVSVVAAARRTPAVAEQRGRALIAALKEGPDKAAVVLRLEGVLRHIAIESKSLSVTGTTASGQKFDSASLRGKVVLIEFWATWCGPCMAEVPTLQRNYDRYNSRGFEIVWINVDDERKALDAYLEKNQPAWTVLHDGGGISENTTAVHLGITAIPQGFLVDPDGIVVSVRPRGKELDRLLEQLLGPVETSQQSASRAAAEVRE